PRAFASSSCACAPVLTTTTARPRTSERILWLMSRLPVDVEIAILADPRLQQRRQRGARILARRHGHDLEADEIRPLRDPALQQRHVVALHELKAAPDVGADP